MACWKERNPFGPTRMYVLRRRTKVVMGLS